MVGCILGGAAAVVSFFVLFYLLAYPALFPEPLARPQLEIDPAEGRVWLDSPITFEVRGSFSEREVLDSLSTTPRLRLSEDDISVRRSARLPFHEALPWAKTRVTINAAKQELLKPETQYDLRLEDAALSFTTITLPEVTDAFLAPDGPSGGARSRDFTSVPTSAAFEIVFNEPISWNDRLLKIDPPVGIETTTRGPRSRATAVALKPVTRFENDTNYTISIDNAVTDAYGHQGLDDFTLRFSTQPAPRVVAAAPAGEHDSPASTIRVEFDRDVDRASVEASFSVLPPTPGAISWESDRVLHWQPAPSFAHSIRYDVSVAGYALGGDPIVPYGWSFRTHDPPVFVEIQGSTQAPTILQAGATGGLGQYEFQWNTGHTQPRFLLNVPAGATQSVEVTVSSGDQTVTSSIQVAGSPTGFVASECPPGWAMVEVSICYKEEALSGPIRAYVGRADLKDPSLQLRSVAAGDPLGATRPASAASVGHGALLAVNGDFFHNRDGRLLTLGPIVSGGNFVFAPASDQPVIAVGPGGASLIANSADLSIGLYSADGSAIPIQGVNEPPVDGAAVIFNGYWGPSVTMAFEACVAVFVPADPGPRLPDGFACGPVDNIGIPSGGFAVVARGGAAGWLQAQFGNPQWVAYSFPAEGITSIVGGSQPLVVGGAQLFLPGPDRQPRTALGVDAGGFLFVFVVDGRSAESAGMTLGELAGYAVAHGLINAINLDGGGSSTMVLGGAVRNRPAGGKERPVAALVEITRPLAPCSHPFVRCH